jgi:hypothetical protein
MNAAASTSHPLSRICRSACREGASGGDLLGQRCGQFVHFLKNLAIAGGMLQVIAFWSGRLQFRSKRVAQVGGGANSRRAVSMPDRTFK